MTVSQRPPLSSSRSLSLLVLGKGRVDDALGMVVEVPTKGCRHSEAQGAAVLQGVRLAGPGKSPARKERSVPLPQGPKGP